MSEFLLITLDFMLLAQNMFVAPKIFSHPHVFLPWLSWEFLSFMQLFHPPSRWWKFENWGALAACELSPRLALSTSCFTCCYRSTHRHTQNASTHDLQTLHYHTMILKVRIIKHKHTKYVNTNILKICKQQHTLIFKLKHKWHCQYLIALLIKHFRLKKRGKGAMKPR